ncbi:MAG TPA: YfcE family phosphodiesterase [Treponema sp.]|nr:YfcE family phosphodiesterase [Treponema sp.]
MNSLTQLESFLIGDHLDVDALSQMARARILVVSDTHGHFPTFERIVLKHGPGSDALLFAGDGIWDVVQYLEKAHEDETYRAALPPVVALVAGNGDGSQYRVRLKTSDFTMEADESLGTALTVPSRQVLVACGHRIFLTHGHHHSVDISLELLLNAARVMKCDIAVFGHTHVPFAEDVSSVFALNPGSATRPRGGSHAGFAIMELETAKKEPRVNFHRV